ncbi:MAG: 50S ribosomal protein L15 [Candidatus Omnitrophota bacterium]
MLSRLKRPYGSRKRHKVVGRGRGSGHGKTSGKGEKGQNSRASGGVRPGFEGGQMPLIRRMPKRGFTFTPKAKYEIVSIGTLAKLGKVEEINPGVLYAKRVVRVQERPVKILGDGELKGALTVRAHAFSKSALEKITKAGGKAILLGTASAAPSKA